MRVITVFLALAMPMAACAATSTRVELSGTPVTVEAERVKADAKGRLVLHLDDVRLSKGTGANVRIYLNAPKATAETGTEHPGFVQSLILVPSSATRTPQGQNFAFPLPPSARAADPIVITFVPLGRKSVTMKRPYVTVTE
jgi:hypothetical protein